MDWAKIAEWTALAVGVVAGMFLGLKEWRERKARSNGLAPNPTRCEKHEQRISIVEENIKNMREDIGEIKADVKTLIGLHLKN